MNQADELEVAGRREMHRIRLPVHQFGRGHARGAVEARAVGGGPWTAPSSAWASRSDLLGSGVLFQEGHRVDLGRGKCPGDAVAGVNPNFIDEKGERLPSHVAALGTGSRLPS